MSENAECEKKAAAVQEALSRAGVGDDYKISCSGGKAIPTVYKKRRGT